MTIEEQLIDALKKLGKTSDLIFAAEVKSVDETKGTCVAVQDGATITGILLKAEPDQKGFMFIPAVGSVIIVGKIAANAHCLLLSSQVSKLINTIGDISFEINDKGIKLNGDKFDGIVKISDLVKAINTIEKDLNSLKNIFRTWITVPQDGGAALKGMSAAWFNQSIKITTKDSLENTNVKHG